MEALLAGDYDDDDDDDDESYDSNKAEEDDDDDDDDNEDEATSKENNAVSTRLPLHAAACAGKVESLRAALEEGARTGQVTIGVSSEGTPRTVMFDLNQVNDESEPPLHAAILAAANSLALAAAPSADPWARSAARRRPAPSRPSSRALALSIGRK